MSEFRVRLFFSCQCDSDAARQALLHLARVPGDLDRPLLRIAPPAAWLPAHARTR